MTAPIGIIGQPMARNLAASGTKLMVCGTPVSGSRKPTEAGQLKGLLGGESRWWGRRPPAPGADVPRHGPVRCRPPAQPARSRPSASTATWSGT